LLEASLSFLGIGLPPEDVSFGSLLYQAKENLSAWWLAVFPGIILSMILVCLYYLMDANEIKR
jgi:peptide/nickel transport system permease protein